MVASSSGLSSRMFQRAQIAERKLAQIEALVAEREAAATESPSRTFDGSPFPAVVMAAELRALL